MDVTEKQRHEFFTRAEEVFGAHNAETLMNLLPAGELSHLATKADLADLRAEFADLRTDFADLRTELKTEVAALRTEFAEFKADVQVALRQQLITFLTANTVLLGLFSALN